jgi:hypothetical protein
MQKENSMGFNACKGPLRFSTPCRAGGAPASIRRYRTSRPDEQEFARVSAEISKRKSPIHIDLRVIPS